MLRLGSDFASALYVNNENALAAFSLQFLRLPGPPGCLNRVLPMLQFSNFFGAGVLPSGDDSTFSNVHGHARPRRSQASFRSLSYPAQSSFWQPPGEFPPRPVSPRNPRACSHYQDGGAGSQFFRVQGVRSDAYRVSASDDRRGNRENWPQPAGLRRKSGHTSFSPSTVGPPQPSGSASSGRIFTRNAIHPGSVNRP